MLFGDKRLPTRFWAKVSVREDGCWIWTACLSRGYGQFQWDGKPRRAHRVSYQELIGPIPDGLQIDHVVARGCLSRSCVNPAHLEIVTHAQNHSRERKTPAGIAAQRVSGIALGALRGAQRRAKTHCPHGHEYSGDNLYVNEGRGKRYCRACDNAHGRAYRARVSSTGPVSS